MQAMGMMPWGHGVTFLGGVFGEEGKQTLFFYFMFGMHRKVYTANIRWVLGANTLRIRIPIPSNRIRGFNHIPHRIWITCFSPQNSIGLLEMEAIKIESQPLLTGRHLEIDNGEQEEPRVVQVAMLLGGEEHVNQ